MMPKEVASFAWTGMVAIVRSAPVAMCASAISSKLIW